MTRRSGSFCLFLAALAVAALAVARDAWPWIADDAFISLRYSDNLLHGHGLVWNPGERVEGYSNLLWVLATAGLGLSGVDLVTAARALAVAATVATLAVLSFSRLLPGSMPARLTVVLLAAQSSLALWAIGGLETPLAMLWIALAMHGLERAFAGDGPVSRRWLGFAGAQLALLAWTRPDGPLWAAIAAATVWWYGRRERRLPLLLALLLPPALAVLAQIAFRLAYYGDWIPNTGHAKVSPLATCLESGYHYLLSAGVSLRALLLPAGIGALLGWRLPAARVRLGFATLGMVVWSLYVLRVGGDVFPRNRFFEVAFAPLCVLAAHGIAAVATCGRFGRPVAWLLALLCIGLSRFDAERPTTDVRQQLSRWEWHAAAIGDWLGRAFAAEQPLLAVDAAGAVPFFSRLPSLDMLGLCDRTIARTPLDPTRGFVAGHNRGNGAYVLARKPDLVLFTVPGIDPIPHFKSGVEMLAEPAFFADHRLVQFETGSEELGDGSRDNVHFVPWLRLEGRAGVVRQPDRVVVPGYLLGCFHQTYPLVDAMAGLAWLRAEGVIGVLAADGTHAVGEVRRHGRHALSGLRLDDGPWQVSAADAPDGVTFALEPAGAGIVDLVANVPATVPLPFRIRRLELRRQP